MTNVRFTHLSAINAEPLKEIIRSKSPLIKETDCICNACRLKFSKKIKDSSYTPEKKKIRFTSPCFLSNYLLCSDSGTVKTSINLHEFNETFSLECNSIPEVISVCRKHRAQVSNHKQNCYCSLCKSFIRGNEKKYSSQKLSQYAIGRLQQISPDFIIDDTIRYICSNCYRYSMRKKETKLTLDDLDTKLVKEVEKLTEVVDLKTAGINALTLTLKQLTELCRSECGFLITDAYDIYLSTLQKVCNNELQFQQAKRSKTWLKCKVMDFFADVVSISKSSSKKGDLIYVSNLTKDEIIKAWNESKCMNRSMKNSYEGYESLPSTDDNVETHNVKWDEFIFNINHLLRTQGKATSEFFSRDPSSVLNFDFENMKSHLYPIVWNIICALTANREELSCLRSSVASFHKDFLCFSDNSSHGNLKRNKRMVIVFLLQFLLNDSNSYPFHVITANCIKGLSHSSRLINIMNKLGFCCSESTLERFLQGLKDVRQISGPLADLSPSSFTIVSIDNIDVLAPYAAVAADKSRSWHGTSIMAQQPKPKHEEALDNIPSTTRTDLPSKLPSIPSENVVLEKRPSIRKRLPVFSVESQEIPSKSYFEPPKYKTFMRNQVKEEQFLISEKEQESVVDLNTSLFSYVCERFVFLDDPSNVSLPGMKLKLAMEKDNTNVIKSKCSYLYVLDEKADCPGTLKRTLGILYDTFKVKDETNHLIIAGDGATIKLLLNIKKEYGPSLDWVIPYLGDWHVLKNFQEVLMKIYWDSGLKEIAKLSHKHITLKSLSACSNFKRTHRFFIQVFEAIYMLQYQSFLEYRKGQENVFDNEDFLLQVKNLVSCLQFENGEISGMSEYREAVNQFKCSDIMSSMKQEFDEYCDMMSLKHTTFKFWNQFLRKDCHCYISLWIAIRSANWDLRLASLKEMVPLFHAFDRLNYAQLIPLHLNMLNGLPDYIIQDFKDGGFVNSLSGTPFSCVAFDEAHEMTINKDCKMSLAKSLPQSHSMDSIAATIQYRAQLINNLATQLGSQRRSMLYRDMQASVVKAEFANVKLYFDKVSSTNMFTPNDQPNNLIHVFSGTIANPQQEKSLCNFRDIGQESYEAYYKVQILHETSVSKPVRRKINLKTFAKDKVRQRRVSDLEKEKKLITLCYKRTIAMSEEHQQPISSLLQFVPVPRAICSPDGLPRKGSKAIVYDLFQKRYTSQFQIITDTFSPPFSDTCVIIEGMNIIYMSPLRQQLFIDYANLIASRWITPYFKKGYKEVRILFDQAGTQGVSPKGIERKRRDQTDLDNETFENIDDNTPVPKDWGSFLKNRTNKYALIRFLSRKFVSIAQSQLQNNTQFFITSGGFNVGLDTNAEYSGAVVTMQGKDRHNIQHNHEETDTQIWLHVFDTSCSNILVYSLDRDISMIGLPLDFGTKEVTVQYCAKVGNNKYLQLNKLQSALKKDSDLAQLITKGIDITKCMQVLYICSGCDFVSFFSHFGKTIFFKVFFQYANFITGDLSNSSPGHLNDTSVPSDYELGSLSFYRLILCLYFNANRACLNKFSNPIELFDSVSGNSALDHHHEALDLVRKASWKGVYEDELMPSNSALHFHWLRSCWVSTVWGQAQTQQFMYPDISLYGYNVSQHLGEIQVDIIWDTEENIDKVKNNIMYLTRGCSCKKNKCITRQCKCRKANNVCGPGCRCKSCENIPNTDTLDTSSIVSDSNSECSELSENDDTDLTLDYTDSEDFSDEGNDVYLSDIEDLDIEEFD
ncbi:uncharacterized protein LOC100890520 isoform X1 [Strongylocentrotus purpuratus]|uniref:CRC domain-containing protein n=1 Tax=Strongylocentrotus purpuratus TaxID=7668 RepID=A0A7M7PNR2_STRPU|nr:uncharacterized protein LOC100890520 isoform X1 [Strongylocentrotus purpuratus]